MTTTWLVLIGFVLVFVATCKGEPSSDHVTFEQSEAFAFEVGSRGRGQDQGPSKKKTISRAEVRHEKLRKLREFHNNTVIPLRLHSYQELVFPTPRTFWFFLYVYDYEQTRCPRCLGAGRVWDFLAKQYQYQVEGQKDPDTAKKLDSVFFGAISVQHAQKMKLAIDRGEPNFFAFGKSSKHDNLIEKLRPEPYNFQAHSHLNDIKAFAAWIKSTSGVTMELGPEFDAWNLRKVNPLTWLIVAVLIIGAASIFCMTIQDFSQWEVFDNLKAIVFQLHYEYWVTLVIVWCMSGQMYNNIRASGLAYQDNLGRIVWVAPSASDQLLGESYYVMLLYSGIAFSIIRLIEEREDALNGKRMEPAANESKFRLRGKFLLYLFGICFFLLLTLVKRKR